MKTSFSVTNRIIFGVFSLINISLIIFTFYYASESRTGQMLFIILCVNFGMFFFHWLINSRFWEEHDQLFNFFTNYIRHKKDPEAFPKSEIFYENSRFLSLFKRTYVEHKLQKKDYNDLKNLFNTFVPVEIASKIGFRGYERIVLGTAERKRLTIMFLDIMRFTTVSENIKDPYRALLLLNIYFDGIGEIIYKHHGYIDKYLGDGILAIFDESNTDDAIRAAIEIQEFIKKFQISTIGRHIDIGIGINTGNVIMGTIGTKRRMDATVIGDTVNVASRLEGMTRHEKYRIIISRETYKTIKKKKLFSIHKIGNISPIGKEKTVQIYGVDTFEKIDLPN